MTLIQLPLIKSHFPMLFHWGIRFPTHKFVGCFPAIAAGNWAALRSGTLGWQSGGERLKWGGQVIYASHRGTFENRKGMLLIILQCRHESTRTVWVQMEPHGSCWGQCWWTQKNFQAKFRGLTPNAFLCACSSCWIEKSEVVENAMALAWGRPSAFLLSQ